MPVAAGLASALTALAVWQAMLAARRASIRTMSQLAAESVRDDFAADINVRIQSLARLAQLPHAQTPLQREEWELGARLQLVGYPGYQAIWWLEPSLEPRWVVASASEREKDLNFLSDERARAALESARRSSEPFVSHSITLRGSIRGLLACAPVYEGEHFDGFVVGVFRNRDLFHDMYADFPGLGYDMAAFDGEEEVYHSTGADPENEKKWGQNAEVRLAGVTWRVRVWPTSGLLAKVGSPPSEAVILIAGVILAALLSVVVYQAQVARSTAAALERARVGRELHDGVIQVLSGLELRLEALCHNPNAPPRMVEEVARIQHLLRDQAASLRELMQRATPLDLAPGQLVGVIRDTVNKFRLETGIAADFTSQLDGALPPSRVCQELARIVQEALVNVRKHSGAQTVSVHMASQVAAWQLVISDDGKGFDFSARLSLAELDSLGKGPVVIKDRVRSIGGELTIESVPNERARLEITIPRA